MRVRYIIVFFLLLCAGKLSAQGFYIDGATVSISDGTVFSVPDSIVNKGTLINNGQIIIAGAWINSGTYEPGTGEVQFDSDLDQVINHNAQSIERLVVSGGGKKEFLADIFVQSGLTLTNGILVSQNGARIVMNAGAILTGGSDNSHVQGPVERKGTGDWVFPIGDGQTYLPVTIQSVNDATAFGIVTLREIGNETMTVDNTLDRVSGKRYFELASVGNLLSSKITLPTDDEDVDGDLTIGAASIATGPYSDLKEAAPTFKFYAVASVSKDNSIEIFNAVSTGSDGKNDFMEISNIDQYPKNKLFIVNRWGDRVFEVSGYDNGQKAFRGYSDNGNKLPSGTYYYTLDLGDGSEKRTGYISVR